MSKYLVFSQRRIATGEYTSGSFATYETFDVLNDATEYVQKNGGLIVKALDIKHIEESES